MSNNPQLLRQAFIYPRPQPLPYSSNRSVPLQTAKPLKLLDGMRIRIRTKHYSIRTESAYVDWARRFILFHGKRHPRDMDAAEIEAFLSSLAVERNVVAGT